MIWSILVVAGGIVVACLILVFVLPLIGLAIRAVATGVSALAFFGVVGLVAVAGVGLVAGVATAVAVGDPALVILAVAILGVPVWAVLWGKRIERKNEDTALGRMRRPRGPVRGPNDSRHPEHLEWANRHGKYSR